MLKAGDIVTDRDRESMHFGKQGLVLGVQLTFWEPPEVKVRFDRRLYLGRLTDDECANGVWDVYPPHQLRRDRDWKPEVYAERLFPRMWHTVRALKNVLDPARPCMCEGCGGHQQKRIWVNIWGTVCDVYVCEEHARHFGCHSCMDSFPWRQTG